MQQTYDQSHKDTQYFLDNDTYNCPFCNRKNITYSIVDDGCGFYNPTNTKKTYYYTVECGDEACGKISFHLSRYDLETYQAGNYTRRFLSPQAPNYRDASHKMKSLDELFFYHDPSAYFNIDSRIPESIREPLHEADACRRNNFLTGASACLRKAIYKLLQQHNISEKDDAGKNISYVDRIDLLKANLPQISELLDDLKNIHALTSQELHENDWRDLDSNTVIFLIHIMNNILHEIYIVPDNNRKKKEALRKLREKAKITS